MVTTTEEAAMLDQLAHEHGEDLRRAAAAYRRGRVDSRRDRTPPRFTARVSTALHRRPASVGCQA